MEGIIENIEIAGIASCVPKHFEDNMDYGNVLGERRVKRQIRLTGIRKRHTSNKNQRASDLAMRRQKNCWQNWTGKKRILVY